MKINFKVGDRVKCINVVDNNKKVLNALGTITEIRTNICVEFDEVIAESWVNRSWIGKHGHKWICEEKDLKLISNETIVIYRNDNEVTALDKLTGKKAVAKCNPHDEFDFYTGAKLALDRLTSNVTFRLLCVKNNPPFCKKGKIYEFINGVTTWDDTCESSKYFNYDTFVEQNRVFSDNFIQLKEGDNPEEILKKYNTIEAGDEVKVIDNGKTYTTFAGWLERNISKRVNRYKWDYCKTPTNGDKGKVVEIHPYSIVCNDIKLAYVEIRGRCYIIGVEGLEKC